MIRHHLRFHPLGRVPRWLICVAALVGTASASPRFADPAFRATRAFGTFGALGAPTSSATQTPAQDESAKGYAFIEVVLPERAPYVGEPFRVVLRAGVDVDVLAGNLVQLFRQPLEVPVQLEHPWFDATPKRPLARGSARPARAQADHAMGVGAPSEPKPSEPKPSEPKPSEPKPGEPTPGIPMDVRTADVALGGAVVPAARSVERDNAGRRFDVLELERWFIAEEAGELALAAPRLGFAYATEFRDDLVAGRLPADRKDAFVLGAARTLDVRPLPEEGRPIGYLGAFGRFTVEASVSPTEVTTDASLRLVLTVTGAPGFEPGAAPRLDRLEGFQLLALTSRQEGAHTIHEAQLRATRAGPASIPSVEFVSFEPEAAVYVTRTSAALPIEVMPPPAGSATSTPGPTPRSPMSSGISLVTVLIAAAVIIVVIIAVIATVSRGRNRE